MPIRSTQSPRASATRAGRRKGGSAATNSARSAPLGLGEDTDLHSVRQRYSQLVRRYHPDRNGGDRSQEARLGAVIDAWQLLKTSKAFG